MQKRTTALIACVVIGLPAGTFYVVRDNHVATCQSTNRLRGAVVSYVDSLGEARKASAIATEQSPTATSKQKAVALANLETLAHADAMVRSAFANEDCSFF